MASGTIPISKGVNNYRTVNSLDDLDNYYGAGKEGFYYLNSSIYNSQTNVGIKNTPLGWCCMLVFSLPSGVAYQMLFSNQLYIRSRTGSGDEGALQWNSWQKATLTQV